VWSPKALAIYEELGDVGKQGLVLGNMALIAFYRGNWDESLELWERGRDACLKTGAQVEAAYGTVGIGEILVYQGHLDEAERALREGLRVLRASSVRTIVAFVNGVLGLLEARRGNFDEAHTYLEAAREEYEEIGEMDHVGEIDGMLAECLVLEGRSEEAVALAQRRLNEGLVGPQAPMLHRVLALAALGSDDMEGARDALRRSLDAARELEAEHEVALTLDVIADCLGGETLGYADICAERDALFARLGITDGGRVRPYEPGAKEPVA
jgi:tetratricopeptide (TPR) repeat protein